MTILPGPGIGARSQGLRLSSSMRTLPSGTVIGSKEHLLTEHLGELLGATDLLTPLLGSELVARLGTVGKTTKVHRARIVELSRSSAGDASRSGRTLDSARQSTRSGRSTQQEWHTALKALLVAEEAAFGCGRHDRGCIRTLMVQVRGRGATPRRSIAARQRRCDAWEGLGLQSGVGARR